MTEDENREVSWRTNCNSLKESGGGPSTLSLSVASAVYVLLHNVLCIAATETDQEVNPTCWELQGQDKDLLFYGVMPL